MNKHYAVIGDPIAHSLSPVMHNIAFHDLKIDADYTRIQVKNQENSISEFLNMAKENLSGFNVTAPLKYSIIPFLDEISEASRFACSVNTVKVHDGKLFGDTTDGIGMECAVKRAFGISLEKKRILIVGAGGVAGALACHCVQKGVASVAIINRSIDKAEALSHRIKNVYPAFTVFVSSADDETKLKQLYHECDLVLQCTTLGMKETDPSPIRMEWISDDIPILDTIYLRTELQKQAKLKGNPVSNGLTMLLYQGVASFRIWTGKEPPVEKMYSALCEKTGTIPSSLHK